MEAEEFYESRGQFGNARRVIENVRKFLREQGKTGSDDYINATGRLAKLTSQLGSLDGALELYRELQDICSRRSGPESVESLRVELGRGRVLFNAEKFVEAEAVARNVLRRAETAHGPDHILVGLSLDLLGSALAKSHRHDEARPAFERWVQLAEKKYGPDHRTTRTARFNLGIAFLLDGRLAEAETVFAQCGSVVTPGHASANDREYYTSYVALALARGNLNLALENADRLFAAETALIEDVFPTLPEEERIRVKQMLEPVGWFASLGSAERIAESLLQTKAITLDALGSGMRLREPDRYAHLLDPANAAQGVQPCRAAPDPPVPAVPVPVDAVPPADHVLHALAADRVCRALPPGHVAVEFVRYEHHLDAETAEPRYGALVFRSSQAETVDNRSAAITWVPLGSAEPVDAEIKALLRSVKDPLAAARIAPRLRRLHARIWQPLTGAMGPGASTVYVSPDGSLCFVPFAVLIDAADRFLAETLLISYVSSTRDLFQLEPAGVTPPSRRIAVFAAPAFGRKDTAQGAGAIGSFRDVEARSLAELELPDLPGSRREADLLSRLAAVNGWDAEVFTGERATEDQLRKLRRAGIIHFATHAFVFSAPAGSGPANPMEQSGLALAGAQETVRALRRGDVSRPRQADGLLTAREVRQLPLAGTWLVTLAACDSGRGEICDGESVLGLRRGFLGAGVQNLLLSLWMVADQGSSDFMAEFYRQAFETADAARALAATQREWLVRLRRERGIAAAVTLAGPFVLNCSGRLQLPTESPMVGASASLRRP